GIHGEGLSSGNSLSHRPSSCFYEGAHLLSHSLLPPCPGIPQHWSMEPSQDQGPLLPLMSGQVILCYTCSWSHGSLHVYSLVGGLVPGSTGGSGWLILLFLV
ncbi:mCG146276, partial [Mus musculus]